LLAELCFFELLELVFDRIFFSAAPDAVVATKFYLSLIQSTLRKLLFFIVAPVLLLVATKYYGFSSGQLLAGWLGGCRQNFSLELQLTQCAHFANDRYLLLLLTMTIISISESSTPHRYSKSPAAAVATTRLVTQLESSDKKLHLETQCPASSSDASCSNAAPQISSTASTTILFCPQLQQRRSAADQQQQQPVTSSSSSTDKRFTRRRSRVISSFGAATENEGSMSQSFLKLERSLPERGAAASKSRNNIASGNLSQCNLSNYCRNSIGEAAALGLTVVAAYIKQRMVVRREVDQEEEEEEEEAPDQGGEEEPHCTVDTPPATSETSVSTAAAILLQDQRSCAPPPPPPPPPPLPQTVIIEPIILLHRHGDCSGHLLVKEHAQDDNATSDTSGKIIELCGIHGILKRTSSCYIACFMVGCRCWVIVRGFLYSSFNLLLKHVSNVACGHDDTHGESLVILLLLLLLLPFLIIATVFIAFQ
jgi:hypothetical protein